MKSILKWAAFLILLLCPALAARADVSINEIMASNGTYQNGHAYDWVELYNDGKKSVDLSGCYLSDSPKNPKKWAFPDKTVLKAGQYLLVYCTGEEMAPGKNGVYYANFKLSASGDQVVLTAKDGQETLSMVEFPVQYGNISYGLGVKDKAWGYMEQATPKVKNDAHAFSARAEAPALEIPGGFYDVAVTVKAAAAPGTALRYTLNGAEPTENRSASRRTG